MPAAIRPDAGSDKSGRGPRKPFPARLYEMGPGKIYERCSEPKETNRQIGRLFRRWLRSRALGIAPVKTNEFMRSSDNAILDVDDAEMTRFAREHFNCRRDKASISWAGSMENM